MASPVAEHTDRDTSHAHRHVDTCQPAQRHPLDSSLLTPTLAGTSSSGRRTRPRACRCCCSMGFAPRLTQATRLPHFCSRRPTFLPLAVLYGNQPELQTGLPGRSSTPSSTQSESPSLSPQLPLHGGARQALEPVDTLEHLLYASCPDSSVSATAPGSNRWPSLFPLQPHLSLSWEPTCPRTVPAFSLFSRSMTLPRSPPFHRPISGSRSLTDAPQPPSSLRGS